MSSPAPSGVPACPMCKIPGELSDEDPAKDLLFFTCFNRHCGCIEYDQYGGVHHSITNPRKRKEEVLEANGLLENR